MKKSYKGFTLIEVLLAVFLFGIVVSTMFGVYTQILSTVRSTEDDSVVYVMAKNCMDRILMDLSSVYVLMSADFKQPDKRKKEVDPEDDPYRFQGESDGDYSILRFTSYAHVDMNGKQHEGITQIKYYVTDDANKEDTMVLRRCDSLDLFDETEGCKDSDNDPILCEDVAAFKLTYVYYDKTDDDVDREDTWDSEEKDVKYATPRAVEVLLKVKDPKNEEGEPLVFETRVTLPIYRSKDKKLL